MENVENTDREIFMNGIDDLYPADLALALIISRIR
jgi:hypothetical protein